MSKSPPQPIARLPALRLRWLRVTMAFALGCAGVPITSAGPVAKLRPPENRPRAVVPSTCKSPPIFAWSGSDRLVIQCDGRTIVVDADGHEIARTSAMGALIPVEAVFLEESKGPSQLVDVCSSCVPSRFFPIGAGRGVGACEFGGELAVVDLSKERLLTWFERTGDISLIRIAPGGAHAAARCSSEDHTEVCLFDVEAAMRIAVRSTWLEQSAAPRVLVRSQDASRVAVAYDDGRVRRLDLRTGRVEVVATFTDRPLTLRSRFGNGPEHCEYKWQPTFPAIDISTSGNQVVVNEYDPATAWDLDTNVRTHEERKWGTPPQRRPSGVDPQDVERWNVGQRTGSDALADQYTGTANWTLRATSSRALELSSHGRLLATIRVLPQTNAGYVVTPDGRWDTWGGGEVFQALGCEMGTEKVDFERCFPRFTPGLLRAVIAEAER